jgi:hypothetical protein
MSGVTIHSSNVTRYRSPTSAKRVDPEVQAAANLGTQAAAVEAAIAARLAKDRMAAPPNIGPDGKPIAGRRRKTRSTRARKTRRSRRGTRRSRR